MVDGLGIGQLAKRGGVGIDTVRYYERNGLLTPQMRLASGYRRYGDVELARLHLSQRTHHQRTPDRANRYAEVAQLFDVHKWPKEYRQRYLDALRIVVSRKHFH